MGKLHRRILLLWVLSMLLVYSLSTIQAYDNFYGVEYDDVINISFVRYIDDRYSITYPDENPFTVTVNYNELNHNVVDELIGMKKKETKDISWEVELENGTIKYYEYRNTKVVEILVDSTPGIGIDVGRIFIIIAEVLAGIAGVAGAVYIFYRVRKRLAVKSCLDCENKAISKCAKCGTLYCSECSAKGCSGCGSRQFVRL